MADDAPSAALESKAIQGGIVTWEKQVQLSARGVQAGRKALRIRHMNGMEVRKKVRNKKRPRGFKRAP